MKSKAKFGRLGALIAASMLALSACGGGGSSSPTPTPTPSPTPTPTPSPTPSPTPTPPASGAAEVLFWTQEEMLSGFPNMENLFDHVVIEAGDKVAPLPASEDPLDIMLMINSQPVTLDEYMTMNHVAGFLVIKDGEITVEKYALGYTEDDRWTSFSVAKSITSTLLGTAVGDCCVKSLDDPIVDYLPYLADSIYEDVTVQQVLTMTTGAAWNEDYSDPESDVVKIFAEPAVDQSDPTVDYLARLERSADPGTVWNYNTGEANLIGSLIRDTTGKGVAQVLSDEIWAAYGMEQDGVWLTDNSGREIAGCCISATLRDFGRFGLFYVNGAAIDGVSILPEGWMDDAATPTQASVDALGEESGYGYMWWLPSDGAYLASGIFGQMIWIDPQQSLVIVTQSAWPSPVDDDLLSIRQQMVQEIQSHYTDAG